LARGTFSFDLLCLIFLFSFFWLLSNYFLICSNVLAKVWLKDCPSKKETYLSNCLTRTSINRLTLSLSLTHSFPPAHRKMWLKNFCGCNIFAPFCLAIFWSLNFCYVFNVYFPFPFACPFPFFPPFFRNFLFIFFMQFVCLPFVWQRWVAFVIIIVIVVVFFCWSAYPIFVRHTILKIVLNVLNCCQTVWRLFTLAQWKMQFKLKIWTANDYLNGGEIGRK